MAALESSTMVKCDGSICEDHTPAALLDPPYASCTDLFSADSEQYNRHGWTNPPLQPSYEWTRSFCRGIRPSPFDNRDNALHSANRTDWHHILLQSTVLDLKWH
jgi:hypothetical protein